MIFNSREALATLARALPLVLFRAGVFVAGGFMAIILFGMLLVAARLAPGSGQTVAVAIALLAVPVWWACGRVLQRFFLYRHRAAMLFLFSGSTTAAAGLAPAIEASKSLVPDYPRWKMLNRSLRAALFAFTRGGEAKIKAATAAREAGGLARLLDLLAKGHLGQAILALAYARGGTDSGRAVREGLVLCFTYGTESRRLARRWLLFSAAGLLILFFCLAVPNWIFFRGAGAPVWIGVLLAAVIARLLHQAFIAPLVLAGVSASLLAETKGMAPDPGLCERASAFFPAATPADAR